MVVVKWETEPRKVPISPTEHASCVGFVQTRFFPSVLYTKSSEDHVWNRVEWFYLPGRRKRLSGEEWPACHTPTQKFLQSDPRQASLEEALESHSKGLQSKRCAMRCRVRKDVLMILKQRNTWDIQESLIGRCDSMLLLNNAAYSSPCNVLLDSPVAWIREHQWSMNVASSQVDISECKWSVQASLIWSEDAAESFPRVDISCLERFAMTQCEFAMLEFR